MKEILSNQAFHVLGVPFIFVCIGVFANRLGRHDGDNNPPLNDLAVGTITLITALGAIAADLPSAKTDNDFLTFAGWFISVLFALFISIDNDRYRSWKRDKKGTPINPSEKHLFWGIILPNLFSVILFISYLYSKSN